MKELAIRCMTPGDLPAADALRAAVGWNQLPADWKRLTAHDPDGCFVAEWNGAPVGTATTTCYGLELAWIGMVLVHPEHRRRGIGKALLCHCLEHLDAKSVRCVKLDATPLGKTLYDQLGFIEEWSLTRWQVTRPAISNVPRITDIRDWRETDMAWMTELDTTAFGVPRDRMVQLLARQSVSALVHQGTDGQGYGLLRTGARAAYLGPLVASCSFTGLNLAKALIHTAPAGELFWDIPDSNASGVELARQLGFQPQRPLIRMFRGSNPRPGRPELCFAIADPSIG